MFLLCSSDFGRSLEESRDDLQSFGYDTPDLTGSYTTLMDATLRTYAVKHPCHGFRRAWAALRYDERRQVNKKKVHRLWREEGLQVRVHSPR